MTEQDRQRVEEVNRCLIFLNLNEYLAELDDWSRQEQIGPIVMELSHEKGTQRNSSAFADELRVSEGWLDTTMKRLAKEKRAVFVVLENDGFEIYRAIKSKAIEYKVPIGWEPWYKDDPIYFWGNSGRIMTVQ